MGVAIEKSKEEKPYMQRDYLDDIEKYVFAEVLTGESLSQNKFVVVKKYIDGLIAASSALNSIHKKVLNSGVNTVSFSDDLFILESSDYSRGIFSCNENDLIQNSEFDATIKFSEKTDIEALCYEKIANARRFLQQAKCLASDEINRGKCEYLIMIAGRVLL